MEFKKELLYRRIGENAIRCYVDNRLSNSQYWVNRTKFSTQIRRALDDAIRISESDENEKLISCIEYTESEEEYMDLKIDSLRDLRIKAKLTQEGAAELCHRCARTWSVYEKYPLKAPMAVYSILKNYLIEKGIK